MNCENELNVNIYWIFFISLLHIDSIKKTQPFEKASQLLKKMLVSILLGRGYIKELELLVFRYKYGLRKLRQACVELH